MPYEEAPPPSEGVDKAVRAARSGCGCLSWLSVSLFALLYGLCRVT